MSDQNTKADERRQSQRFGVSGKMSGELTSADGNHVEYMPVDVSQTGLGVVAYVPLTQGDEVQLKLTEPSEQTIKFSIAWCIKLNTHNDKDHTYRCGLNCTDSSINFEKIARSQKQIFLEE
jgi:hypothetical protein